MKHLRLDHTDDEATRVTLDYLNKLVAFMQTNAVLPPFVADRVFAAARKVQEKPPATNHQSFSSASRVAQAKMFYAAGEAVSSSVGAIDEDGEYSVPLAMLTQAVTVCGWAYMEWFTHAHDVAKSQGELHEDSPLPPLDATPEEVKGAAFESALKITINSLREVVRLASGPDITFEIDIAYGGPRKGVDREVVERMPEKLRADLFRVLSEMELERQTKQ